MLLDQTLWFILHISLRRLQTDLVIMQAEVKFEMIILPEWDCNIKASVGPLIDMVSIKVKHILTNGPWIPYLYFDVLFHLNNFAVDALIDNIQLYRKVWICISLDLGFSCSNYWKHKKDLIVQV